MKWYKLDYFIVGAILLLQFGFIIRRYQCDYGWGGFEKNAVFSDIALKESVLYTCILIGYYIFRKVYTDLIDKIAHFFTE